MSSVRLQASSMGVFGVRVRIYRLSDPRDEHELELTVDTGATYPVIPRTLAQTVGVTDLERRRFTLANGEQVERDVGYIGMEYEGHRGPVLVVLGERKDASLLGALALETLGYEVDPVSQALRPATQYLMSALGLPPGRGSTA